MRDHENVRERGTRSDRVPARTPEQAPSAQLGGLLGLQAAAGSAAVVQMLRAAGHPWAQEQQSDQDAPSVQRSAVHDVLRSAGRPMDDSTRTDMESRLGADFSDVRIHDNAAAKASAAEVGARAYTSGSHVVIGDGGGDKHTLAHELTHVIQQRQGPVAGTDNGSGLKVSDPSDRFEREAEANATRAMSDSAPLQRQEHAAHTAAPGTGGEPGPVQRALTINGRKISDEYRKEAENQSEADQQAKLNAKVDGILNEIKGARQRGELSDDEWQQILGSEKRILEQLRKLIVSPVGEKGLNKVLGVDVGKHPEFGAKNRDVQVNDYVELVRGLMGWVDSKENRKKEKAAANEIKVSRDVDILLNSLLLRINGVTERIKSQMSPDKQKAMEHELVHGVAHELAAGGAAKAGKPFGAYLTYFNPAHDPKSKFRPGEALAHLATTVPGARGGIQEVMRNPETFAFRDKIMVLHDLMEYFGPARHFPPTMGTDQLTDIGVDDTWSTSGVDATGVRNQRAQDRGQNPRNWQGGKEHPSTRNENSETTKLARTHKAPVWAGQSYTAARMFNLARGAGGTQQEIAAVAWGIFAFWRLDFDHTTAFAYHTLHEVMDIAQNFGVPYNITDQYAGKADLPVQKLVDQLNSLQGQVAGGRQQVQNGIDLLKKEQQSGSAMWTDEHDQAVDAAVRIAAELDGIAQRMTDLANRLANLPAGPSRAETELAQALQESLARIPVEYQSLSDQFAPVLAKAQNP